MCDTMPIKEQQTSDDRRLRYGRWLASPKPGEEIVISGLSAKFPSCTNAYEFSEKLYNKMDLITGECRWIYNNPAMPARVGYIPGAELFDCSVFGMTPHAANLADPLLRVLLENALEAIMDAGINPEDLAGTRTAIIGSTCSFESGEVWKHTNVTTNNLPGVSIPVAARDGANILSYILKVNGPSMMCDSACSSTAYSLDQAYTLLRKGHCDAALVFGSTLLTDPRTTSQFYHLGLLSPDGVCRSFDATANGYVRSEARCAVFLQRTKDAKRIYGQLVHTKTSSDGFKLEGITFPSGTEQETLAREAYEECGVNPKDLFFLEAHGPGTKVGDPEELNAVDRLFCKNRKEALPIGSVKANLGHTEPVAALASIIKILLGMENGYIAPNIHFKTPRPEVPAFKEGRLKVLLEKLPYKNQNAPIACASYGFGGANCHLILRGFNKKEKKHIQFDGLPRLVCFGGRTEATVRNILKDLTERDYDPEYIALLQSLYRKNSTFTHPHRGFAIVSDKGISKTFYQKQKSCSDLLFVIFPSLEDWWVHMGQKLIKFPLFKNGLDRASNILSKNGIDISNKLITKKLQLCNTPFLNFIVQIIITDILKELGLQISKIFTGSYTKILAAYYHETITLEEALNAASVLEKFVNSSTNKRNQQDNNSSLLELQEELDKQFSKLKRNYFDAKSLLNTKLPPLIKLPKRGTILEFGFTSSRETMNDIISDSLQVINFFSNGSDRIVAFLETLGRLYVTGFDMNLEKLYPAIQYPVSKGTPMISPLISWEHSLKTFYVMQYGKTEKDTNKFEFAVKIDISSSEWSFITGHVVNGRILFPATGYLYVVWKELAALNGLQPEEANIIFDKVRFKRTTPLTATSFVNLLITIFDKSGYFEINESGATVVTGYVRLVINEIESLNLALPQPESTLKSLDEQDVYKELKLRGYNYSGLFKASRKVDQSLTVAEVQWFKNWISFMDNVLQVNILSKDTRNLYVPTGIDRIVINSVKHMEMLEKFDKPEPLLPIYVYHDINYCRGGYVEIFGAKSNSIPKRKQLGEPVLEKYQFVPNETSLSTEEALRVNIQITLENHYRLKVKTVEVFDDEREPLSPTILSILGDIPLMEPDINILSNKELEYPGVHLRNTKLVTETEVFILVGVNILLKPQLLKDALTVVKDGYIITRQTTTFSPEILFNNRLEVLTSYKTEDDQQILLRVTEADTKPSTIIKIPNTLDDFSWLELLKNATKLQQNVILLAQNDAINGILGLFNCIKLDYKSLNMKCIFIQDKAAAFDPSIDFYKKQLKKQFAVNIFKAGKWGTYRHLLLNECIFGDSEHAYVNTLKKGDLSTLKWIEGPLKFTSPVEIDQQLIQVYYTSLNFRDVMTATGKISADVITSYRPEQDCVQGLEFSGKDMQGRRVVGLKNLGALSSIIMADKTFLIPVPDQWTLQDAATVPAVYGTVLYALVYRVNIKRGQSILIHAGTGGIGQAAIRIAFHYGLHVYTTVGTEAKRQFIKDTFPQITDQQIGNSRDVSFEALIMKQTKGRGVDVVLNSLAEEKLQASVRCVSKGGHFVEIGKFDLSKDNPLPLKCFAKGVSHHGVMLDLLFDQPPWIKSFLMDIIKKGMQSGAVQPLNRIVFQKDQVEEAFRYMAAGKHVGKVLIELRKEDEPLQVTKTKCSPRYYCNSEYTQLILGGLGGFGLELADWLVLRGAKKLVLTSRTGVKNGYQASRLRIWRSYGVHVVVSTANTATKKGCLELVREANKLGPVESMFNLAVVLQDALLENQSELSFESSFQPKAVTTAYLDKITRKHCPSLRTFVVFSSVSCGRGNAGQTNYGMANSIMERICEKRKQEGLPGLAIQWGAIADVGLVAETQRGDVEIEIGGTLQQRLSSCLDVLDRLLRQDEPVVSSMVVAEKRLGAGASGNLVSAVANVLGIKDLKTISLHASLAELGMDSMMSVEIKQMIETELDVMMSSEELRELSLARLQEIMQGEHADKTMSNKNSKGSTQLHDLIVSSLEKHDGAAILVVPLKSSVENNSGVPVIALPGIEGTYSLMTTLAAQLTHTVLCCQYLMKQQNNIEEIADTLIEELCDVFKHNNSFKLICHSLGSSVALWMARKLEAQGKEGKIVFIDGTPAMSRFLGRGFLDEDSYLSVENSVLYAISANYLPSETLSKVTEMLNTAKSYEEKVNKLAKVFPKDKQHYLHFPTYVKSAITRLHAFKISEKTQTKIKAQCLLCKAADHMIPEGILSEDYGLSEFLEKQPIVAAFGGTHTTILENPDLAKYINEFLF